jgi:hypothetical protein
MFHSRRLLWRKWSVIIDGVRIHNSIHSEIVNCNYSAVGNSHTHQFITVPTESFQSNMFFTNRCLATDPNNVLYFRALTCSAHNTGIARTWNAKVKVMLWPTVSQSVCHGVKFTLETVTRYYILSESWYVVSVGRPLWREVGSVPLLFAGHRIVTAAVQSSNSTVA